MPRSIFLLLIVSFCVLSLSGRTAARSTRMSEPDFEAGEVLVMLDDVAWQRTTPELEALLGGRIVDRIPELRTVQIGLSEGESISGAIARIHAVEGVAGVEPNYSTSTAILDDTYFGAQQQYLDLIEAPAAWETTAGDSAVIVAVLDSGIDLAHPDLQGRIWRNALEIDGNDIDDDDNGCTDDVSGCSFVSPTTIDAACPQPAAANVLDDNGHGTFVAGIIAATANNGIGVTGAAPGVTVMAVKILDCLGNGSAAEAAKGLLYAARNGARVANVSFSARGESLTLAAAIRQAHDRYGMIVVAATGNEGVDSVTFPARLPETIAVGSSGAIEGADERSPFSDWGPEVDVVAPGLAIASTVPAGLCGDRWHCLSGQPYAIASGTSFAAPFVSSLAALIVSQYPNLNPETVRNMILQAAQPLPDGDSPGWDGAGRIRMVPALQQPRYQIGAPGVVTN